MSEHRISCHPNVSIGLPVYNGAASIARALKALLGQTFTEFELVISDNHSTDGTYHICQQFASEDSRIRLFRQPETINPWRNFHFVLERSTGHFFKWHAHDDWMTETSLELMVHELRSNPLLVGTKLAQTTEDDWPEPKRRYDFSLEGNYYERVMQFLWHCWVSHSAFYGLFRREPLLTFHFQKLFRLHPLFAADWFIVIHLLGVGSIRSVSEATLILGNGGASQESDRITNTQHLMIEKFVPLFRFSSCLVRNILRSKEMSALRKLRIISKLFGINKFIFTKLL